MDNNQIRKVIDELNNLNITFKKPNTESVYFFDEMGCLDFINKIESIIINLGNKELVAIFYVCRKDSDWLRLYYYLHKIYFSHEKY